MGLFDNLFLDQNTPVMINDGVDHSQDVVTASSSGKTGSSSGATGNATGQPAEQMSPSVPGEKNDKTLDTLFEEEKKEIVATDIKKEDVAPAMPEFSAAISAPVQADVPSSSEASASAQSSDISSAPSFDIGGDISFDIGGDISQPEAAPISDAPPAIETPSSQGAGDVGGSFIAGGSPIQVEEIHEEKSTTSPETPETVAVSVPVEIDTGVTAQAETPQETHVVEASTSSVGIETSQTSSQDTGDAGLLSFLTDTPSSTPHSDALSPVSDTPSAPLSEDKNTPSSSDILSPLISDIPAPVSSSEMGVLVSGEDTLSGVSSLSEDIICLTASPTSLKLRSKIEEFIDDLKAIEIEDHTAKEKKRQQFEAFRIRREEIQAEYDMRMRALELEQQELEKQIKAMDGDKKHIKDIINRFSVHLENA